MILYNLYNSIYFLISCFNGNSAICFIQTIRKDVITMRESYVEQFLRKQVELRGGLFLKFVSPGWNGAPDRLLVPGDGRTIYVEMKAPGRPLRPLQKKRKQQLEALKCDVRVIDTVQGCVACIEDVFGA